jgi:HlyD family secretion protein
LPTQVRTPTDGPVLKLFEQSERVVPSGAPIVEIGFTPRLEVASDFLTREAVRIRSGMPVLITDWGGDKPLRGHVRIVEPGAFTKVSALGVEEQRANVICDFDQHPDGLQDAYHLNVRVITWQNPSALAVPSGAVFRSGEEWAVFAVRKNKASMTLLKIGHKGEQDWEVLDGLNAGEQVIVHTATQLSDGVRVTTANSK